MVVLLAGFWGGLSAQQLSERATVSLYTAGPGTLIYELFGHSAIGVKDPVLGIDKVYNYGTFSFNEPGFVLKFARGKLKYMLSTETPQSFIRPYEAWGRWVKQQELDLTLSEKQEIFQFLETNAKPENKYYLYDFFFDNCASRLRDVLEDVLGDKLQFDYSYVERMGHPTYRELLDPYLTAFPWTHFGIDMGLGSVTDKEAPGRDYMFLPDFLFEAFANAKVVRNGVSKPLVKNTYPLLEQVAPPLENPPFYIHPIFICWMIFLLILGLTFLELRMGKNFFWLDFILMFVFGLAGLVVLLLWVATDHDATKVNLNAFWLMPLHLIVAFFLLKKTKKKWLEKYFILTGAVDLILLVGYIFLPQQYHPAFFPLLILMLIRLALLPRKVSQSSAA